MKKLKLLYIFICASLISNAQLQQETFNGATLPMGWTATSSPSACNWQFGYTGTMPGSGFSNPASFPSGAAIFIDDGCADDDYSVELEGPAVDLAAEGITSVAVEIVYNHQTFSNDGEFMVDVWDGSTWQNILTVSGDSPASNSGNNQTVNIDVTAHINNAFKVKFIYDDEDSLTWGIGIDDYKLLDTATAGIEDLVDLGFNYYPNPIVEDVLTLQANENISIVNIYNTIGQKVIAKRPVALKSQIQMQHLPEGVYIINVAIGQREGSFKVIKR